MGASRLGDGSSPPSALPLLSPPPSGASSSPQGLLEEQRAEGTPRTPCWSDCGYNRRKLFENILYICILLLLTQTPQVNMFGCFWWTVPHSVMFVTLAYLGTAGGRLDLPRGLSGVPPADQSDPSPETHPQDTPSSVASGCIAR